MKKLLIVVLICILILPVFTACKKNEKSYDWPESSLASNLPKPDFHISYVSDFSDSLRITFSGVEEADYLKYLEDCQKEGFSVDVEKDNRAFDAYNEKGFRLNMTWYSNKDLSLQLDAPIEMSEISWPNSDLGRAVPQPKSLYGRITHETSEYFYIYIGKTPKTDYDAYVKQCQSAGFTVDYEKGDDYYNADNSEGYVLNLDFLRNNTMLIHVKAPKETEAEEIEEESEASEETELTSPEELESDEVLLPEQPDQEDETDIPSEYYAALRSAETYSSLLHMSKAGIYDQLTSEYGDQFTPDAAQYAVDHLNADFNQNALKKAEEYDETMHMSKAALFDQLTSEYGEKFTQEEAQYAVDHLEADYYYNALLTAKEYRELMNMSDSAIYSQLVSEYGEKFTAEEAQYAIDNLD